MRNGDTKTRKATPEEIWEVIQSLQAGKGETEVAAAANRSKARIQKWQAQYGHLQSLDEARLTIDPQDTRYVKIMKRLFQDKYVAGSGGFSWKKSELHHIAGKLDIPVPNNLSDNIYSIRHGREDLPEEIRALAPKGKAWLLLPDGRGQYRFVVTDRAFLTPDRAKKAIKIPDSTPQIVARYAKQDEQAVLARIRYCRLVDIFMGLASYQLQSHMRTSMAFFNGSQTELDELYVGVDSNGTQFIIPIQAKGPGERIGTIQIVTDYFTCQEKFPGMIARTLAAQTVKMSKQEGFGDIYTIALIEGSVDTDFNVTKLREEHFELVPASQISDDELAEYRLRYTRRMS